MDFLDKLSELLKDIGDKATDAAKMVGDKASDAARKVSDKTSEALEINRQTSKVNSEKAAATEDYAKIGEFIYGQYISGTIMTPEIAEFCESAKAHLDAAAEAQAEIDRIRKAAEEAKAAAEAAKAEKAAAAAEAGDEDETIVDTCAEEIKEDCAAQEGVRVCKECGTPLGEGMIFCGKCGVRQD